jgi:(p)ppGpp synthase/HD superfamily hydrolase
MTKREKLLEFATKMHEGVYRKDGVTPYIEHPKAVAAIALEMYENGHWIAEKIDAQTNWDHVSADTIYGVAILHDREDVPWVTHEMILERFGKEIANGVKALTDEGEATYLDKVLKAKQNLISRLVKVADNIHNGSDLPQGNLKDKYLLSRYILETYSGGPTA